MIASVVAAMFGFLSTATFTRLLSPDDYGIYVIGVGLAGFVSAILFTWVRFSVMRLQSEGGASDFRTTALVAYGISVSCAPLLLLVMAPLAHRSWQEVGCAIVASVPVSIM